MTRTLKVAIASFAHVHAWSYLTHLLADPTVEVLASDPDGADAPDAGPRGREFADLLGVPYVESYDELLAWGPDAVVVCTENSRHPDLVKRAFDAGAHVLCEKPLATTPADAERMVAWADEAGLTLMTAYPIRFTSAFAQLRARVEAGHVGEVLGVLGTNNGKIPIGDRAWFTDPELAGGGALVDHVVHCADLLDALLGVEPETVHAVANDLLHRDRGVAVETGGFVTLRYPGGVVATIDCSWSQPLNAAVWGDVTLQVVGTGGSISMSAMGRHISGTTADGGLWVPFGLDFDGAMIQHFLDCVRTGATPASDGRVGLRTARIVAAAQESARTGRAARLAP